MSRRKVLLRVGPFTDRVYAITKYRLASGGKAIIATEKHDVTEDFEAIVRERVVSLGGRKKEGAE